MLTHRFVFPAFRAARQRESQALRMNPLKKFWAWLHGDTKATHSHHQGEQLLNLQDDPSAANWPDATREAAESE
jgi:hypothetical protein